MKSIVVTFEPTPTVDAQFVAELLNKLLAVYEVKACVTPLRATITERRLGYDVQFLRDALTALRDFTEWHAEHFEDFSPAINAELLCLANVASATRDALESALKDIDATQA